MTPFLVSTHLCAWPPPIPHPGAGMAGRQSATRHAGLSFGVSSTICAGHSTRACRIHGKGEQARHCHNPAGSQEREGAPCLSLALAWAHTTHTHAHKGAHTQARALHNCRALILLHLAPSAPKGTGAGGGGGGGGGLLGRPPGPGWGCGLIIIRSAISCGCGCARGLGAWGGWGGWAGQGRAGQGRWATRAFVTHPQTHACRGGLWLPKPCSLCCITHKLATGSSTWDVISSSRHTASSSRLCLTGHWAHGFL